MAIVPVATSHNIFLVWYDTVNTEYVFILYYKPPLFIVFHAWVTILCGMSKGAVMREPVREDHCEYGTKTWISDREQLFTTKKIQCFF